MTRTLIAISAITFSSLMTLTNVASADIIAERKAGFRSNVAALKTIRAAMGANDFNAIANAAESIADWSARMTEYFPEGSGTGNTNARMAIWDNFDDFTVKAKDAENAALTMVGFANAGDMDGVKAGFGKVSGTCKSCHSLYKD